MRNPIRRLTSEEYRIAARAAKMLADCQGPATVQFVKRDGTERVATGPIIATGGHDSHVYVTLDETAIGRPTTINLYRILSVNGKVV